ncbi:hypothetical protein JTB14_014983 [Gonioctena quinquepunctata]|nr:hypothetical protein JTB14_014983 [Gonioctena quinquepunctata]
MDATQFKELMSAFQHQQQELPTQLTSQFRLEQRSVSWNVLKTIIPWKVSRIKQKFTNFCVFRLDQLIMLV